MYRECRRWLGYKSWNIPSNQGNDNNVYLPKIELNTDHYLEYIGRNESYVAMLSY